MPAPLRVVHVVETCCGGVATFASLLIGSQMNDPMFSEVHLLHDGQGTEEKVLRLPHAVSTYTSSRKPWMALGIARELHQRLSAIKPDIVFLHSSFPGFWGRIFRGSWKVIYCPHGWSFTPDFHPLKMALYKKVEAALSYRCDAIVSISNDEFRIGHEAGVRDGVHDVIRHGLPAAQATSLPPLPLDPAALNLAFVGRFERQKGLDILEEIFDDPRLSHITVWLAGGDVRGVSNHRLSQRPNFRLLGWLDESQINALLQQVDALIMPSRWEGFGLVALEAMRNRKAVIASRVGGLPELVLDGINGRLMDIRDVPASRDLLAGLNKPELARMGEAAREIFDREFRWDVCYGKWRTLVARVAKR